MSPKVLVIVVGGFLTMLTMATGVYAQQPADGSTPSAASAPVAAPAPAVPAEDAGAGAYPLRGGAVESGGGVSRQSAVMAPYEISGTGMGGSRGSSQVILTTPVPERGAPFRTEGGIFIYPSVFVGYGYNDNVQTFSINKVGSSLINVSPQVMAEMKRRGDRYTAMFLANHSSYGNSGSDDYTNYEVGVAGDNYFSARARMGWALGQINSTDSRGSNSRPISSSPDRWHAPTLRGSFIYGAPEAAGRVEVDADVRYKRYDNNLAFTEVGNLDEKGMAGRFFYRLGSRSLALVEVRNRVFDYTSSAAIDDNTDRRLYLGYTWEATAATTGIIKFGRMTKRFEQTDRPEYSGSTWEATVRWLPRSYSAFEFTSAKAANDPAGLGNYLVDTRNSVSWKHNWSGSFTTVASVNLLNSRFAGTSRVDDIRGISLTAQYNPRRWLMLGVDFANTDLQSSDPTAAWKRNVIMFTAIFTL